MLRVLVACALALASSLALAAVNLNTATHDELVALPGIGPAKARAILDYRAQHGGFKSAEELKDVKGIGAKRYEKLKAEVTVSPLPRAPAGKEAKASAREGKPGTGRDGKAGAGGKEPVAAANGSIRAVAEGRARP
jgi:competence protein ComEA